MTDRTAIGEAAMAAIGAAGLPEDGAVPDRDGNLPANMTRKQNPISGKKKIRDLRAGNGPESDGKEGTSMHFDLIRSLIADQFMIDADTITMDTNLVDDLGADSLDVVDLIMSVEEELNVSIQDENISNLRTVRDIVSFLDKLTGEQED